jgi:hypothetical protein
MKSPPVNHDIPGAKLPGVVQCLLYLAATKLLLRLRGFATTLRWIKAMSTRRQLSSDGAMSVESVLRRVSLAGAVCPFRARCLEQSLVLYYCLRRLGLAATLRIGVQPQGFLSHAWVEYQGEPIGENGELLRKLIAFPAIGI